AGPREGRGGILSRRPAAGSRADPGPPPAHLHLRDAAPPCRGQRRVPGSLGTDRVDGRQRVLLVPAAQHVVGARGSDRDVSTIRRGGSLRPMVAPCPGGKLPKDGLARGRGVDSGRPTASGSRGDRDPSPDRAGPPGARSSRTPPLVWPDRRSGAGQAAGPVGAVAPRCPIGVASLPDRVCRRPRGPHGDLRSLERAGDDRRTGGRPCVPRVGAQAPTSRYPDPAGSGSPGASRPGPLARARGSLRGTPPRCRSPGLVRAALRGGPARLRAAPTLVPAARPESGRPHVPPRPAGAPSCLTRRQTKPRPSRLALGEDPSGPEERSQGS